MKKQWKREERDYSMVAKRWDMMRVVWRVQQQVIDVIGQSWKRQKRQMITDAVGQPMRVVQRVFEVWMAGAAFCAVHTRKRRRQRRRRQKWRDMRIQIRKQWIARKRMCSRLETVQVHHEFHLLFHEKHTDKNIKSSAIQAAK
jgi:hypothetical protein